MTEQDSWLHRALGLVGASDLNAKLVPAVGDPGKAPLAAADEYNADLIVVGNHHDGRLHRLLHHGGTRGQLLRDGRARASRRRRSRRGHGRTSRMRDRKGTVDPPPKIMVDVFEQGSGIPMVLRGFGAAVTVESLPAGDYRISGGILVERKTVADLHGSLGRGRLWAQVGKIRDEAVSPFLLDLN